MTNFTLIPFDKSTAPKMAIAGKLQRQNNQLSVEYKLTETSNIIIPKRASCPQRQLDLWTHTCCEFFLGLKDASQYWEFNLSPAGHWNVFRFDSYRQNMEIENVFNTLPFQILQQDNSLLISLNINLNKIVKPEQNLQVGVTTVIEDNQNQLSYWALNHPGKEADFHLSDSFAIAL